MCWVTEQTVVTPSQPPIDEVIELSILDQHALRMYSKFVIVFKMENGNEVSDDIQHLKNGLGRALSEHPEFAANVIHMAGSTRKELELQIGPESGVPFKIVDHSSRIDDSKHCHELLRGHNYEKLERNNFPLTKIPEEVLFVDNASPEGAYPTGIPTLNVQVNIIDGGLLLGISWHHTVADAGGVNMFVKAWAKATNVSCTHGDVEPEEISTEMSERWRLSYGIQGASIADFPEYVADASARSPNTGHPHLLDRKFSVPSDSQISMWQFSAKSLQSLVNLLNCPGQGNEQRYTPVEALSALLWKHLSLARQLNILFPEDTSLFTTRIDFRRRLSPPLPVSYIGNVNQPVPRTRVSIRELCTPSTAQSLADLAQRIRGAVAENDDKIVRQLIGYVDTLPAVTDLALEFDTCPGPDIAITDLSGLDVMHQIWGNCLGRAVCIRGFVRYKGFAAFLPQDPEGGTQVHVQCEAAALESLKSDSNFTRYGQFLY
ncbi:trichothecene 3-O-acetyltransferase [Ilyonectria destructans]|nr:trichothecene 3-O-acetyltransferase [Ilyonectria destructans]